MKIIEKNCDIIDSQCDVIIHVCNAFCTMGAGVALALKNKWPKVYEVDLATKRGDANKFGKISVAVLDDKNTKTKYVINCYAQFGYGRKQRQVDYEALYICLEEVRYFCFVNKIKSLAIPKNMASTLAGGDWRIVKCMIEVVFGSFDVDDLEIFICNYPGAK